MTPQTITPTDKQDWLALRAEDITSTEVSALFGVSPYSTLFELWHRKRDKVVVEIEENERMRWGNLLQDSIAKGVAEDQGWKVRRMDEYMRIDDLKMGASFDFSIEADACECGHPFDSHSPIDGCLGDDDRCSCKKFVETGGLGLLEIKNVDGLAFLNGWSVDGDNIEAPPHIEIQVQHQLAVSGRAFAYIGALVGGNRLVLVKREPDPKIIDAIKKQVASFWFSIAAGKEPAPDFSRDAKFISKLYGYADPGKIMDVRGDANIAQMAQEYRELGIKAKEIETARDAIKAQLLMKIGDAEKVTGDTFTISAGVVGPAYVEYNRDGYRAFRISWKKVKEA